jgi:hypothetical protein
LAAELLGTAERLREEMGALVPACERAELAAVRAQIADRIGAEALDRASALGRWQDVTVLVERIRLGSAAR